MILQGFFSLEIFEITKQIYPNLFRKALPQNQVDINIEMFWQWIHVDTCHYLNKGVSYSCSKVKQSSEYKSEHWTRKGWDPDMVPSSLLANPPFVGEKQAATERTRASFRGLLLRDFSRLLQMTWVKGLYKTSLIWEPWRDKFLVRESEIKLKYFVRMKTALGYLKLTILFF